MNKQTKDLKIFLKITPEEHTKIKKKAALVGMNMTQLVKYLLLNAEVKLQVSI